LEAEGGLSECRGSDYMELGPCGVLRVEGGGLLLSLSSKKKGLVAVLVPVVLLPAKSSSTTSMISGR